MIATIKHPNKIDSINVNNAYNEAEYVLFSTFQNIDFLFNGFQYDSITDEDIKYCLNLDFLDKINIDIDWEDDYFLYNTNIVPESLKHAVRIAKIVQCILNGNFLMNPVSFDTFSEYNCLSCINNGHHRIRALQFLGYEGFPVTLSGELDFIDSIKKVKF